MGTPLCRLDSKRPKRDNNLSRDCRFYPLYIMPSLNKLQKLFIFKYLGVALVRITLWKLVVRKNAMIWGIPCTLQLQDVYSNCTSHTKCGRHGLYCVLDFLLAGDGARQAGINGKYLAHPQSITNFLPCRQPEKAKVTLVRVVNAFPLHSLLRTSYSASEES